MEIILHVGAHRTATTALQRLLGQARPLLRAEGLGFWGPKRLRNGLFRGLYGGAGLVLPWQADRAAGRIRLQAAEAAAAGMAGLFISEENMLGTMASLVDETRLYPGAGTRVARFAEGLQDHRLTVALSLRCYDSWWASVLAFRMMRGGQVPRPGLIDRLITQPRRWRHLVADLAQAVPEARIVVWTYEAQGGRPDTVLEQLTGCRLPLSAAVARHNVGPDPDVLRDYLKDCGLNPRVIRTAAGRFMPFDDHQRAILRAQYAEDLAWLAAGAGGLAEYLDEDGARTPARTGQGRGHPDDGAYEGLARSG